MRFAVKNEYLASKLPTDELCDQSTGITDGLPTQGKSAPRRNTVSGPARLKHYRDALRNLPNNVPVNVVLSPMEGDPAAASEFWKLAQETGGSFMAPAEDWP